MTLPLLPRPRFFFSSSTSTSASLVVVFFFFFLSAVSKFLTRVIVCLFTCSFGCCRRHHCRRPRHTVCTAVSVFFVGWSFYRVSSDFVNLGNSQQRLQFYLLYKLCDYRLKVNGTFYSCKHWTGWSWRHRNGILYLMLFHLDLRLLIIDQLICSILSALESDTRESWLLHPLQNELCFLFPFDINL